MGGCKQLICFIISNFSFIFKRKIFYMHKCKNMQTESKKICMYFHITLKEVRGLLLENH